MHDPAELAATLAAPATASAQYFHGNCFAGYAVAADLRIQESRGVRVALSSFS